MLPPDAPAATARAIQASGSSTNTSTLTVVVPSSFGLSKRFVTGSCRKNGALSISKPSTDPKLHNKRAPSAFWYQATACGASGTASMSEIKVLWVGEFMVVLDLGREKRNSDRKAKLSKATPHVNQKSTVLINTGVLTTTRRKL